MPRLLRSSFVISALLLVGCASESPSEDDGRMKLQVPLYGVWEQTWFATGQVPTDLTMTVTFTGPDGRVQQRPAFWAGGLRWRARFQPDTTGLWHYTTAASSPLRGLDRRSGRFEVSDQGSSRAWPSGPPVAATLTDSLRVALAQGASRTLPPPLLYAPPVDLADSLQWATFVDDVDSSAQAVWVPLTLGPKLFDPEAIPSTVIEGWPEVEQRLRGLTRRGIVTLVVLESTSPAAEALAPRRYALARLGVLPIIWATDAPSLPSGLTFAPAQPAPT
ncbi:MAG: DUF5060 domain-containing protein, partial [Bacteroidota bacterium]